MHLITHTFLCAWEAEGERLQCWIEDCLNRGVEKGVEQGLSLQMGVWLDFFD